MRSEHYELIYDHPPARETTVCSPPPDHNSPSEDFDPSEGFDPAAANHGTNDHMAPPMREYHPILNGN